ncbi:hypothetical protein [Pedobacter sp. MW01-1-1]|uniref:hypothetical protein n=1 Tax=Pedobacter sp. MW01-1-1 TaxID=3383027 RepID=UPI003FEF2DCA
MRKILNAIILLLSVTALKAQDLAKKVPANAFSVATIKSSNFTTLMTTKEFSESFFGQKFLKMLSNSTENTYANLEDLGINLQENAYYFNQITDSLTYHTGLIPIKDITKFEQFITTLTHTEITEGNPKTITFSDSSTVLKWNNNMLCIATGNLNNNYFSDPKNAARYDIEVVDLKSMYPSDSISIAEVYDPKQEENTEEVMEEVEVVNDTTAKVYEEEIDTLEEDTPEPYDQYQKALFEVKAKEKAVVLDWVNTHTNKIFQTEYASIESIPSFVSSTDKKAIAEFWVANLSNVYSLLIPESMIKGLSKSINGFEALSSKLYMDEKNIKIHTEIGLSPDMAKSYQNITKRKPNKKFLKYIDSEKAIGFTGYSIDTKAYLTEFPSIFKKTYSGLLDGNYDGEIDLGAELFSLLIDEEAVSKVVKGDALFVFNGLNKKETTYTDYEYDDDYNRSEVTKTKNELLPDFLFMFSSDDTALFNKITNYLIKKNLVTVNNHIYKISEKKSPIDMYFLTKNGIVFFGNSLNEMERINNNSFTGNISKAHKSLLAKSNFSLFFNAKNLAESTKTEPDMLKLNTYFSKMGNMYIKSNPVKNNSISSDIVAEVPNGQQNALKYLIGLFTSN